MNKKMEEKIMKGLRDLTRELKYVTKFVGIEYCKCIEREDAEDDGTLNRDEDGYFYEAPSFGAALKRNRIEFCPFCSKRLDLFRRE